MSGNGCAAVCSTLRVCGCMLLVDAQCWALSAECGDLDAVCYAPDGGCRGTRWRAERWGLSGHWSLDVEPSCTRNKLQ